MKRIIVPILTLIGVSLLIGFILSGNKKANEEKIELINLSGGAVLVQTSMVSKSDIEAVYSVNGNLIANRELEMKSENAGIITSIQVKEGDFISKGQVLAILDDKFLSIERQNAQDAYQKIETDKERYESSFKTNGVTQAQLDEIKLQLKNAENRLKEAERRSFDASIKAPISGIINERFIETGSYLGPGSPLFEIVDVSTLKLKVNVDENHITKLDLGDKVSIVIPAFPDKTFLGTIHFIAAKADEALNFPVEIKIKNESDSRVKAGMYASATFESENLKNILFIPRKAFLGSVSNKEVYVLQNDNTVQRRTVVPGRILGDKVEILEGLTEGEQVVITGQINLSDGAKVKVQE